MEGTPKTKSGKRVVLIDEGTVAALQAHRLAQAEEWLRLGKGRPGAQDYVFTSIAGEPLNPDYFSDLFDRHVKAAGLRRVRLHDLRHSQASILVAQGLDIATISARMGHSRISTTLDLYVHAFGRSQADAVKKLTEAIG